MTESGSLNYDCAALDKARRIAEWIGGGKPLTPKGALRPVDVHQVAGLIGAPVPAKFRSAVDVPAWLWSVVVDTGMVSIESGRVVAEPPVDITPDLWLVAFGAAQTAAFDDENGAGALAVARAALTVLETQSAGTAADLYRVAWHEVGDDYDLDLWKVRETGGYEKSGELLIAIFAEFGMITEQTQLTELGRWALAELTTRGDGVVALPPADHICQLKITLKDFRPACWRRVLVPAEATLGGLHSIIQAAMRWDGDHLHAFKVGRCYYGDPDYGMNDDEYDITLSTAFTSSRKTIGYTYDFGDDWRHDITLEKTLDVQANTAYPICVAGNGAVPVEDTVDLMIEFDQHDINRRLGALSELDEDDMFDR